MATVTTTCPSCGAGSSTADYCDGCGAILQPSERPPAADGPGASALSCPGCTAGLSPGDAFCEVCGLDFTSGEMPAPPPDVVDAAAAAAASGDGAVAEWVAVVEADRAFFDANVAEVAGSLSFPADLSSREVRLGGSEVVVGRRDAAGGFVPGIDLAGDPAVSRRHALLRRQPEGYWSLVDLGSANGTWVNGAAAPVEPEPPISLFDGDRVHLGAFTVLRLHLGNRAPS